MDPVGDIPVNPTRPDGPDGADARGRSDGTPATNSVVAGSAGIGPAIRGVDGLVVARFGIGRGEVVRLIEAELDRRGIVELRREDESPALAQRDLQAQTRRNAERAREARDDDVERDTRAESERSPKGGEDRERSDELSARASSGDRLAPATPRGDRPPASETVAESEPPNTASAQRSPVEPVDRAMSEGFEDLRVRLRESVREAAASADAASMRTVAGPVSPNDAERLISLLG